MKTLSLIIVFSFLAMILSAQENKTSDFTESEITLRTNTGELYGSLTIPANVQLSPVVIIIPGSGPTDRDCNSPLGVSCNAYKMLAKGFAEKGISCLRFDKRGIGKSQSAMTKEDDLRFETYVYDVQSWISLLKGDKRFSKIVLLGHSEGSLIGILAAQKSNVSGYISVAGIAKPADAVLREQLKGKLPPQLLIECNNSLDTLKAGKMIRKVNPNLNSLFRPSVQPYMISWIKYDPSKEISKLHIPVLIIQGTADLQVSPENAKLLYDSKPGSKLKIFDNMNHILKESGPDPQVNMATYKNPDLPLKTGLSDEMTAFVKSVK